MNERNLTAEKLAQMSDGEFSDLSARVRSEPDDGTGLIELMRAEHLRRGHAAFEEMKRLDRIRVERFGGPTQVPDTYEE